MEICSFHASFDFRNHLHGRKSQNKVKSDLKSFLKGKQYYHRLGRVWRHSCLLYGPSRTGKSSFVAAMTNFLSYNVYDIDVSKVSKDSDLNSLLLGMVSHSIIVIKDFDWFLMEKPRTENLSVIMKFMDGILNSCIAEERLMVFTMNSKEHLLIDPAILRLGRIDVHIHFPLCEFSGLKSLYLSTQNYTISKTTCLQGRLNSFVPNSPILLENTKKIAIKVKRERDYGFGDF